MIIQLLDVVGYEGMVTCKAAKEAASPKVDPATTTLLAHCAFCFFLSLLTITTQATDDLTSLLLGRHTLTTLKELVALGLAAYAEHPCKLIDAPVAIIAGCPERISSLERATWQ